MKEEKKIEDRRVNLKISQPVYARLVTETKDLNTSVKAYTEAAVMFFASRKLDPATIKEGDTARILTHLNKGVDRVLSYIVTQEQQVLRNMFAELVNTRIVCEILLSNLHQLSDLSGEEQEKLNAYNNQYLKQRKDAIQQHYQKK